ncbi:MFS general substrate transporter [Serendipita vermifera]|nr:MFS general substrate transporter [Serendipita vermifera]
MATNTSSKGSEKLDRKKSNLSELIRTDPVIEKKADSVLFPLTDDQRHAMSEQARSSSPVYKLYRRRWLGLLGMVVLNIVAAMNWIWFSPIANDTADAFGISLTQVNWLSQTVNLVYLPMALAIPTLIQKLGIRKTCISAAVCLLFASWIRYAGTTKSLSNEGAYALLIIAQIFAGIAQPVFQVLGPKFSETWFDLKARTTATMVIAVANPVGSALGQLLPPFMSNPRVSVLVLAIATTACLGLVVLIQDSPPTPPTYAGSRRSPPFLSTVLALFGRQGKGEYENLTFTSTEKLDFAILVIVFGVLVGCISSFSILTNQIAPVGYSEETAGFVGAALLLLGLLAGLITSPLFDRVLTHHLALTVRLVLPPMAGCWIGLIFAVRPNNAIPIFVLAGLIGCLGFLLLPVGLELGCEVTRNAEVSSALLWMSGNLWTLIFVIVSDKLRDPNPPHNMRNALILLAAFVSAVTVTTIKLTGRQTRRELDMDKNREANNIVAL